MKIYFTEQSLKSLIESLEFFSEKVNTDKLEQIRDEIIDTTNILLKNPKLGQLEEYLEHLELGHRRIIKGHYKIIYRLEGQIIYITDIFDTRQEPNKMKG